jgi:heat shock protein HslJ
MSVPAKDLWGRDFVGSAVRLEGGNPTPISRPRGIHVSFASKGKGVGWEIGCNENGAKAQITANRLRLGTSGGTLVGCDQQVEFEEAWLGQFFESDPYWRLDGRRLTLTSGDAVVELEGWRRRS